MLIQVERATRWPTALGVAAEDGVEEARLVDVVQNNGIWAIGLARMFPALSQQHTAHGREATRRKPCWETVTGTNTMLWVSLMGRTKSTAVPRVGSDDGFVASGKSSCRENG